MNSSPDLPRTRDAETGESEYSRLESTTTFRGDTHCLWRDTRVVQVGAGAIGSRLAPEIARSGGHVRICDPDHGQRHNLGTQWVDEGELKAVSVAAACERIAPGSATALPTDIRHVGIAPLADCQVIIDTSDDPDLVRFHTEVSNGLQIPLVRIAVDGSGERELGRVTVSHGGGGHACQICTYSPRDLFSPHSRTSCVTLRDGERDPTRAGGGIALTVVGLGLLQAQRLVVGNDLELALDRETLVDLSSNAWLAARLGRNADGLSGHEAWELSPAPFGAEVTPAALLERASGVLGRDIEEISLEIYAHPIRLCAGCPCGEMRLIPGTRWMPLPDCCCGEPLQWRSTPVWARFNIGQSRGVGIEDRSLLSLGAPPDGAMVVLRARGERPLRWVLQSRAVDSMKLRGTGGQG